MGSRLNLQSSFESILDSRNVYFQPPASVTMSYPAIVYSRKNILTTFADGSAYKQDKEYEVIVIYENPDSAIPDAISKLPKCRFDRHYTTDGLHHDVFRIFY